MITPVLLRMGVPLDEVADRGFGDRINEPLPPPYEHLTTRRLLQAVGGGFLTDVGHEGLAHLLTMPPVPTPALIESVRRPEEAAWLRAGGFALLRLERPSLGGPTNEHVTECDLGGVHVDATVINDRGTDDLLLAGQRAFANLSGLRPMLRREAILVLNGRPGCGKDTLTRMLATRCRELGVDFHFFSSIAPVKRMLHDAGVDTSAKTPRDRDLLARLKQALEIHDGWPTRWVADCFEQGVDAAGGRRTLLVTHVREPEGISALADHVGSQFVVAVWMARSGLLDSGATNAGDNTSAADYAYHGVVANHGTLEDLEEKSHHVLQTAFCVRT